MDDSDEASDSDDEDSYSDGSDHTDENGAKDKSDSEDGKQSISSDDRNENENGGDDEFVGTFNISTDFKIKAQNFNANSHARNGRHR